MEERNSENEKLWENEADNMDSLRRFEQWAPEEKERLVREFDARMEARRKAKKKKKRR